MYGMAVDTPTLTRNRRASRPTELVEAIAYFLQARREVYLRDFNAAEWSLRHAIEIDPTFAMAYWAMGEVNRLQGDPALAGEWYAQGGRRNKDHPRWSIEPAREAQPVPALLAQLRAAEPRSCCRARIIRSRGSRTTTSTCSVVIRPEAVSSQGAPAGARRRAIDRRLPHRSRRRARDQRRLLRHRLAPAPHAQRPADRRWRAHPRRHRQGLRHRVRDGGRRRHRAAPGFPPGRCRARGAEPAAPGRSRRQARHLQGGFRPPAPQRGLRRRQHGASLWWKAA